jgi:transcriptional regulator with XRE-family HTH domain
LIRNSSAALSEVARAEGFGTRLKTWRRLNNLKQAALAQMLGVSQPAIARWEAGLDTPNPDRLKRLLHIMDGSARDELALERLFIRRQAAMRALFDYDGLRMLELSEGFRRIWPDFSNLLDRPMVDHIVGEAQSLVGDRELHQFIVDGSLGLISGVSDRHTDHDLDHALRHRWHACFRRYGSRTLVDIVYEPCGPEVPTGVTDIIHLDALDAALGAHDR